MQILATTTGKEMQMVSQMIDPQTVQDGAISLKAKFQNMVLR
jgi:hypothetical protein